MTIPIINVVGEAVPDRHAARVVVQMTRWLDNESIRIGAGVSTHRSMFECGSPLAQQRFAARMARYFGYTVLDQHLQPGKRGRYRLDTHVWMPAPAEMGRHFIAGMLLTIKSEGGTRRVLEDGVWHRRQNREHHETPTFMVSGHALQRIAQRTKVRDPMDLLQSIRSLGKAVLEDEIRIAGGIDGLRDSRDMLLAGVQKVPFDGGVAVLKRDRDEDVPIVVTVLPL